MSRRSATVAVLVVWFTAVLLGGCGGSDEPVPKFSPTPSATPPAPSPSTAPPAPESAGAFIRRWAQVDTAMQNTGDTTGFRAISVGCRPCNQAADVVEGYYAAGGYVHFEGQRIISIKRIEPATAPVYRVVDVVRPSEYSESTNAPIKHFPGGRSTLEFTLGRIAKSWNVVDFVRIAS